jgi:hypothetical protein
VGNRPLSWELLQPRYHGNPVGDGRSLVTIDWSYDIGAYLSTAGGLSFAVVVLDDMSIGSRDAWNSLLVAKKPSAQHKALIE